VRKDPWPSGVGPQQRLVNPQTREQVRCRCRAVQLLYNIEAVVQEGRRRTVNGFALAAPYCVIRETGGEGRCTGEQVARGTRRSAPYGTS
jgi:hypothetical protein